MYKRIVSLLMAAAMTFGSAALLPEGTFDIKTVITASAEGESSGVLNGEVKWEIENGVLTLSRYDEHVMGLLPFYNKKQSPFYGRTDITSVVIMPDIKYSIGSYLFEDCKNLSSVTIPDTIDGIGEGAFSGCKSLEGITLSDNIYSIGKFAFTDSGLKSITIPKTITYIEEYAFSSCTSLEEINIPDSVTRLDRYAFARCTGLKDIKLPSSIETIGRGAFTYCPSVTEVTLPEGVKSIGENAFENCYGLKKMTLPSTLTSIGPGAFRKCQELSSINLPDNLTSIGFEAFELCSSIKNITLPKSLKTVSRYAFRGTGIQSITIPKCMTKIDDHAFSSCGLTSVTIPSSIKSIEAYAFWGCTSLKSITIPKSVTKIGKKALGYYYVSGILKKVSGFTISGYKGTAAEKYAKDNGFKFVARNTTEPKTVRYAGSDRAQTASLISSGMYKTADTVVLATGFDFHDALAAVPLASAYNAPLLLADRDNLSAKTLAEIKRLKAKNVIVVASTNAKDNNGKSAAIKSKVYKQLKGYNVTKLVGSSYYETAKKVAQQLQKKTNKAPSYVFFTTNKNYADALSVSPVAAILKAPIFYVDPKGKLNANTTYYLKSVKSSVKKIFVIGGTNAISKDVVAKIKAVLPGKTVQRFNGADRYATCVRINNAFKSTLTGKSVCIAKGYNFPDALAGGVFAAKQKAPLFLADKLDAKATISKTQANYLYIKNPSKLYIFGGETAVPTALVKTIAKACV